MRLDACPATEDRSRRRVSFRRDGLYASRLLLGVPDCPRRCRIAGRPDHAADRDGSLRPALARPATGRLDDPSHGIPGRARHAAFALVRALVPGRAETQTTTKRPWRFPTGPAATASLVRWATAGGWNGFAGPSKPPRRTRPQAPLAAAEPFGRHPAYGKLSQQARLIRQQIQNMPLVATATMRPARAEPTTRRTGRHRHDARGDLAGNRFAPRGRLAWFFRRCESPKRSKRCSRKGTAMLAVLHCRRRHLRLLDEQGQLRLLAD